MSTSFNQLSEDVIWYLNYIIKAGLLPKQKKKIILLTQSLENANKAFKKIAEYEAIKEKEINLKEISNIAQFYNHFNGQCKSFYKKYAYLLPDGTNSNNFWAQITKYIQILKKFCTSENKSKQVVIKQFIKNYDLNLHRDFQRLLVSQRLMRTEENDFFIEVESKQKVPVKTFLRQNSLNYETYAILVEQFQRLQQIQGLFGKLIDPKFDQKQFMPFNISDKFLKHYTQIAYHLQIAKRQSICDRNEVMFEPNPNLQIDVSQGQCMEKTQKQQTFENLDKADLDQVSTIKQKNQKQKGEIDSQMIQLQYKFREIMEKNQELERQIISLKEKNIQIEKEILRLKLESAESFMPNELTCLLVSNHYEGKKQGLSSVQQEKYENRQIKFQNDASQFEQRFRKQIKHIMVSLKSIAQFIKSIPPLVESFKDFMQNSQKQLNQMADKLFYVPQKTQNQEVSWLTQELNKLKNELSNQKNRKESSTLFNGEVISTESEREFLLHELRRVHPNILVAKTKLLYRYSLMKDLNPHQIIDEIPNYIILLKMKNIHKSGQNYVIGLYSERPLCRQGTISGGLGFIASLTNQKAFYLKKSSKNNPRVTEYNEYYFIFGNSEVRWRISSLSLETNIGHNFKSFDTEHHKNPEILTGSVEPKDEMRDYEIFQIFFRQN